MGKCGGRELNYASDVDVVFVAEAADGADELFGGYARYEVCDRHLARIGTPPTLA